MAFPPSDLPPRTWYLIFFIGFTVVAYAFYLVRAYLEGMRFQAIARETGTRYSKRADPDLIALIDTFGLHKLCNTAQLRDVVVFEDYAYPIYVFRCSNNSNRRQYKNRVKRTYVAMQIPEANLPAGSIELKNTFAAIARSLKARHEPIDPTDTQAILKHFEIIPPQPVLNALSLPQRKRLLELASGGCDAFAMEFNQQGVVFTRNNRRGPKKLRAAADDALQYVKPLVGDFSPPTPR